MKTKLIALLFLLFSLSAFAIIGGTPVASNDPLAKVTVSLLHDQGNNQYGVCTGVLISRNVVLTAAHCVIDDQTREWFDLDDVIVVFGLDVSSSKTIMRSAKYAWAANYKSGDTHDDMALVFFDGELPEGYQVAELADDDIKPIAGSVLHIAGYGISTSIGDSSSAGTLRKGTVTYSGEFNNGQNFRVTKKTSSICVGDSGGPLFLKMRDSFLLYGIAYLTTDGCRSNALYSSVQGKRNWISDALIKIYEAMGRESDIKSFDTLGTIYKIGSGITPTELKNTYWSGRCFSSSSPLSPMAGGFRFGNGENARFYWGPGYDPSIYDYRLYSDVEAMINSASGHISFTDSLANRWTLYEGTRVKMRFYNEKVVVEVKNPNDGQVMMRCLYSNLGIE